MEIDSAKVRAFYQLALDKSFSKASRSLAITQPGLSQKISRLEDELETTLVIRGQKEITLTDSGLELIRYYKTKVELDKIFFQSINPDTSTLMSEIRIASFSSVTVSVIIPLLGTLIKEIGVFRFNVFSREVSQLEKCLFDGEVDFIISTKEINRERVQNICIGEEEDVHIAPKLKKNIQSLPFLDHDAQDSTTFNFLKIQGKDLNFRRCYLNDINGIIKGVETGIGQAIASRHIVQKNPRVRIISHHKKVKSKVYLSFFEKPFYPESQKKCIELFKNYFSNYL